jgi:hypothetical protein
MSKQRRIKSNDTNRATFKRPNTMATLRNKSTILTVAHAPKYDKNTAKSPSNRIHTRRRVKRRRRQKPLDVERTCRHPDQCRQMKVAISIEIKWRQHESIAPHARRTHPQRSKATQSITPNFHALSPLEVCLNSSTLSCTLQSSRARRLADHRLSLSRHE